MTFILISRFSTSICFFVFLRAFSTWFLFVFSLDFSSVLLVAFMSCLSLCCSCESSVRSLCSICFFLSILPAIFFPAPIQTFVILSHLSWLFLGLFYSWNFSLFD